MRLRSRHEVCERATPGGNRGEGGNKEVDAIASRGRDAMKYHEGSSFSLQCQYVQANHAGQRGHADGGWQDNEEVVDGRCVWTQGHSLVDCLVGKGTKLPQ